MNAKVSTKGTNVKQQVTIMLSGFFLVIAIVGIASKIGIDSLSENNLRLEEIVVTNNQKFKQLTIMSDAIRDRMLIVYNMSHTSDSFDLDDLISSSREKVRDFIQAREQLTKLGLTPYQLQQLDEQRLLLSKAQIILNSIINQALNKGQITDLGRINEARAANNTVLESLLQMKNSQNRYATEQLGIAKALAKKSSMQIIWLALAAFVASAAVIGFITRHMISQNVALNLALQQLHDSNEQLEHRVEERTNQLMHAQTENMRMTAELDVGKKLQEIILPSGSELAQNSHLDIAAYMEPADEIGGDYYDILQTPSSTHISIGDVTGHGLESGIVMLMTQATVRTQLDTVQNDLKQVLINVNRTVYENVQRMESDKHLTLALLSYHYDNGLGKVQLCGQHESVIIVRANGEVEEKNTDELGFPIGLIDAIEDYTQVDETIQLHAGDTLVLYTDGITEAADREHTLFGTEKLKAIIQQHHLQDSERIKSEIINAVKNHIGEQKLFDDLTLVVIKQRD